MAPRYSIRLQRAGRRDNRYRIQRCPLFLPTHSQRLLEWFHASQATWPWRKDGVSPFGRLVAEMLLRQTTARQVARVWPVLLDRYPVAQALANAEWDQLHDLLRPLGLVHQRCAALQAAAQYLVEHCDGAVPAGIGALEQVPHVGPYVANAVRCFAFRMPVPIVDVNVLRIFRRFFGRQTVTKNPHREAWVWLLAQKGLPQEGVVEFNYALLDLAHQVCRRDYPLCDDCPLAPGCQSRKGSRWN